MIIEIPQHDSPLTEGVVSFWSAMRTAGVPIDGLPDTETFWGQLPSRRTRMPW